MSTQRCVYLVSRLPHDLSDLLVVHHFVYHGYVRFAAQLLDLQRANQVIRRVAPQTTRVHAVERQLHPRLRENVTSVLSAPFIGNVCRKPVAQTHVFEEEELCCDCVFD